MAVHLCLLLLILTVGLTGIHSLTVSEVSVKAGDSISIPCFYGALYKNHVKYLCKGYTWDFCSSKVKTNEPSSSGKFLISDDKSQNIFTVTLKDLTEKDAGDYWCIVEIDRGPDKGEKFHLSVTRGTPRLSVDHQQITAFKGDNITINCHYHNSGEIAWCRPGVYCVTTSPGSLDGTRVTISRSVPNVFSVTMSGLRTESSGWYWCVQGELQMPVNVTVLEPPTTIAITATSAFTTLSSAPETVNLTTVFPDKSPTTAQGEQHRDPVDLMPFVIPLSLLIFVVMVTLCIWFVFKRRKQNKAESSATTMAQERVTYSTVMKKKRSSDQAEEEVTYSNVAHVRKTSVKRSEAMSDADVMYAVVAVGQQTVQKVGATNEDVTYSCLAPHQQGL